MIDKSKVKNASVRATILPVMREQIEQLAKDKGVSISEIVRLALEDYIEKELK